jgi:hypothetical protein
LEIPLVNHPKVISTKGDVTRLNYIDDEFDLVLCCEVLEHIPTYLLSTACKELARVTRGDLVVGVPYQQDLRSGQTTCPNCKLINPPWGHVNTFDEFKLAELFPEMKIAEISYIWFKE